MTVFWAICAALLIVALLFVVWPLWRHASNRNDVVRDAANLEILRDQSAELEADLRSGLLTQEAYEQGKRELQARLLEEVKDTGQPATVKRHPAKVLAMALAVLLPLCTVLLYSRIGNSNAIRFTAGGEITRDAMLEELERKVSRHPDDLNSLVTLARAYSQLKRFQDSVRAYDKLVKAVPDEAQVWAEYADVLAMVNKRSLAGEPERYLTKALELDGNNLMALELAGVAAMERRDYVTAITHWQKLLSLVPQDSPDVQNIREGVRYARDMLAKEDGGKEKLAKLPALKAADKAAGGGSISGRVTLSPVLAAKAAPDDVIYVFARDQGEKGLLAVMRKQVKDLPMQFTLDDSMAMQPQARLSSAGQVTVVARISKTGNPAPQSGDLQGARAAVKPGSKGVNIVIDTIVP